VSDSWSRARQSRPQSGSERRQVFRRRPHPGRHGVAAEFVDETWVRVACYPGRRGYSRRRWSAPSRAETIVGAREGNDRAVQSVFDPAGDQTYHALVQLSSKQAQPEMFAAILAEAHSGGDVDRLELHALFDFGAAPR